MRIAITGTTGRVGQALARRLEHKHDVVELPRSLCDLADSDSLSRTLATLDCDFFINPAGITRVDACERDPLTAMRVNSGAPGKIAIWAAERGVRVIHFSTDYVFDGKFPGWRVEAEPAQPINAYGRSKLAGERAVLAHAGNLVLRVSWVFGPEKPAYVDQVIQLALAGEPLAAVADKWSLPTSTVDLAMWVEKLLETDVSGVLHACNPGAPVSWHGIALVIVRELFACGAIDKIPPIEEQILEHLPTFLSARPKYSAMDTARLASHLGFALRPWNEALRDYVLDSLGRASGSS